MVKKTAEEKAATKVKAALKDLNSEQRMNTLADVFRSIGMKMYAADLMGAMKDLRGGY